MTREQLAREFVKVEKDYLAKDAQVQEFARICEKWNLQPNFSYGGVSLRMDENAIRVFETQLIKSRNIRWNYLEEIRKKLND